MILPDIKLELLSEYLLSRGWFVVNTGSFAITYAPPTELELPETYTLTTPRSSSGPGARVLLARLSEVIAELYETSPVTIAALLSSRSTTLAMRLQSLEYETGSLPFPHFESLVEKLRSTLLHTASFVVQEEPRVLGVADEAYTYLDGCRFLQTEAGSFITNVQLPSSLSLSEPKLFEEVALSSDDVNERISDIIALVTQEVLSLPRLESFGDLIDEATPVINLDVLQDIRGLLSSSQADQITFEVDSTTSSKTFSTGRLSPSRMQRLDDFILSAQEKLAADEEIDVVGRIIELRSRRPDRRRNHVGVAAIIDNREVLVSIRLGRRDYPAAIMAHRNNRPVHIRGAARQLRTQLTITRLDIFEEVSG